MFNKSYIEGKCRETLIFFLSIICLFIFACGSADDNNSSGTPAELLSEKVHEISIEMDETSWNQIRHTARSPVVLFPQCGSSTTESPYTYVTATVTVDGTTLQNVGVRTKGFLGSINPERPSLKIKFNEFVDSQKLGDIKRMTLNNNNQDGSRMRTYLGYDMFQKAGLPAPDCSFAHVTVNGKDLGVYSNVEPIKKSFLRKWFQDDEGNLYEAQLSDFTPDLVNSWERKTNDLTADDRSDLEAIMTALETDDADLIDALSEIIDLDAFFEFWAMEIIANHWDGYSGDQNNCYIYNDPGTGKFTFIPWGTDSVLSSATEALNIKSVGSIRANTILTKRLYDHPQGKALFLSKLNELYQVVWADDAYMEKVRQVEQLIKPYVAREFNADFVKQVDALYAFMQSHSQNVKEDMSSVELTEDYPYAPLERCFSSMPEPVPFSFTFSTGWGTNPGPGIGSVSQMDIPNDTADIYSVSAGPSLVSSPGLLSITLAGFNYVDMIVVGMSLNLSPYKFLSGEPIVFDNLATMAVAFNMPSYLEPMKIDFTGFVVQGELVLTEAGMNAGDKVSGTFEGTMIYSPSSL